MVLDFDENDIEGLVEQLNEHMDDHYNDLYDFDCDVGCGCDNPMDCDTCLDVAIRKHIRGHFYAMLNNELFTDDLKNYYKKTMAGIERKPLAVYVE